MLLPALKFCACVFKDRKKTCSPMAPLWINEGEKESTVERAKQPVTTADQNVLLVRPFIHHCRPSCIHVIEINEDIESVGGVAESERFSQVFPASSHQQPTWWMSMLSTAIQTHPDLPDFYFLSVFSPFALPVPVWLVVSLPVYSKLSCTLSILSPSPSRQTLRVSGRE